MNQSNIGLVFDYVTIKALRETSSAGRPLWQPRGSEGTNAGEDSTAAAQTPPRDIPCLRSFVADTLASRRAAGRRPASMARWKARNTMPCRENERAAARGEKIRDRIDPLQTKIDIEDSAIDLFALD